MITNNWNILFIIQGETGYPWIDAIMKQLKHEGWIHHVARHAVSTFLTRGDLWISWVDGLRVRKENIVILTRISKGKTWFSRWGVLVGGCKQFLLGTTPTFP